MFGARALRKFGIRMWTDGQGSETQSLENRTPRLPDNRDESTRADSPVAVRKIGIWVQGVDRLGAAYEGIWRVIKRFLLSSEGSGTRFCFVAPERFREEIEEFLVDLPDPLRSKVDIEGHGLTSDRHEADEEIRQASHANQLDVDAWLVPNPMWGAAKHLIRPKLVWFHDFLLVEFPQSYPRKLFLEFQENVRELADAGALFVFTSPYVKEKHGHEFCGIPADQSILILNPPIDGSTILADAPVDPHEAGDFIRSELRENLARWCTPSHAELFFHHISSYPFESLPYFFVSSQNREHKGFLRLAQAHAALVRQRYLPYSVFTTALVDVAGSSPLEKFLKAELHMGDFMSVGKVTDVTNALLYKFAKLTIHPSTFEGNLPLPFAESVSVGTPCIMPYSRAYADYLDPALHPWVFYNPTAAGIVQKVEEIEQRRPDFLDAQKDVLGKLRRHTLKDFFNLHMKAFGLSRHVQPRAVEYLIASRHEKKPEPRPSLLRNPFRRSVEPARRVGQPMVQARLWEPFELVSASGKQTGGSPVLHWAAYLGSGHPTGDSYFILHVEEEAAAPEATDLGLVAEIGTWIGDEYDVADSRPLRFERLDEMPPGLMEAFEQSGLMRAFGETGRMAWTKLGWSRGIVPEIRIAGRTLPGATGAKARLACLTRLSVHSGHHPIKGAQADALA